MKTHARRAFPAWAVPALVSLLAAAPFATPGASLAAEGGDSAPTTQFVTTQVMTVRATAAPASAAPSTAAPAMASAIQPAGIPPAAVRRSAPAPRPIAAGPVWTDASGAWRQVGVASWYGGRRWQGRMTAAGVRYDERLLTAAHASLPLGSQVRVTVADSGRSVIVTINDRPGTRKRIIDLSRAAADELGIVARGVARVTLTPF
jgi:rare lipoprotein A